MILKNLVKLLVHVSDPEIMYPYSDTRAHNVLKWK